MAGAALSLYCLVKKESWPTPSNILKHTVLGIFIFVGGIVAVVWAQQFISSSLASAIITTPFWFVLLDRKQWSFYFNNKWIVGGLLLGLLGVIFLASNKSGRIGSESGYTQLLAIFTIITGSFFWVGGSLYSKYNPSKTSVYVNTSVQLLSAGLFCLPLSLINGELIDFQFHSVAPQGWFAAIYLAIASSLLGFLAFMWLIKEMPPAVVSTYSYVNPVVATLLGWLFANEQISLGQLAGLFIILLGVLFVNIPRFKPKQG